MRLLVALSLLVPSPVLAQEVRLGVVETPRVSLTVPALGGATRPGEASPATLFAPIALLPATGAASAAPVVAPSAIKTVPPAAVKVNAFGVRQPSVAGVPTALRPVALTAGVVPAAAKPDVPDERAKAEADKSFDGSVEAESEAGVAAGGAFFAPSALLPAAAKTPSAPTLADLVKANSRRELKGVFIQQEQEGTFLARDPKDGSGDFFRWYRPVEVRPALVDSTVAAMGPVERFFYRAKRLLSPSGRDREFGAWNAMGTWSKLRYLGALESAVVAEKGRDAAWKGKVTLLLEKAPGAPAWLTENPHTEPPAEDRRGVDGWQFLQPELVSDKGAGVTTVAEAIGRSKYVISQTGHAGTQYHVFMKLAPEELAAKTALLTDGLQAFNDVLFAEAAAENLINAQHPSLMPWHQGRSGRAEKLLSSGSKDALVSDAGDADSEKHAFVGLRYWGIEDGKAVVSLELRGAGFPWKARPQSAMGHGMETAAPKPERDSTKAEKWLTLLSVYAEGVAAGRGKTSGAAPVVLSAEKADETFAAYAKARGLEVGSYASYTDLAKRLSGRAEAPQGWLYPFAVEAADSPALRAYMDVVLGEAVRMKADVHGEQGRLMSYLVGDALKAWARGFERRASARLEDLVFSAAGGPTALSPLPAASKVDVEPVAPSIESLGRTPKPNHLLEHLKTLVPGVMLTGVSVLMNAPFDNVARLVIGLVLGAFLALPLGIFFAASQQAGEAAAPKVVSTLQPKPESLELIARVAKESGFPPPSRVRVLDTDQTQAMAGGLDENGWELAFSRGLESGDPETFESVLRHEFSHVKGRDSYWTLAAMVLTTTPMMTALVGMADKPDAFGWLAGAVAAASVLLFPAVLRHHEYVADQYAASAPKGVAPLARFLVADSKDPAMAASAASGTAFAAAPKGWQRLWASLKDRVLTAFKVHPSHDRRLARLARLAK